MFISVSLLRPPASSAALSLWAYSSGGDTGAVAGRRGGGRAAAGRGWVDCVYCSGHQVRREEQVWWTGVESQWLSGL